MSLVQTGGQLAYILSPILLEQMFTEQINLPFYIAMIPSFLLMAMMLMCDYLPGGKSAGQVSLQASLENNAKMEMITDDNEYETEYLGNENSSSNVKSGKKRITRPPQNTRNDFDLDGHYADDDDIMNGFSPSVASRFSTTRTTMYDSMHGEDMEI